jgi:single-stranded-DNA-specific exonuclease
VVPYLPHRVDEGHGLSTEAIDAMAQQGVSLIITVDCGVTSVDEVRDAQAAGVDVIITDHHTLGARLPPAVAIVNPKMADSRYPYPELSGAGLAFKLAQGLYQYYGQPWDRGLLELAALGTIADLVPLTDENRLLVSQGLDQLARTTRPGLQALCRRAGVSPQSINAETVSFQIIPRLNSSGRMSHAMDSFRLLTTDSPDEAEALAQRLEQLNLERRDLTQRAYAAALDQVRKQVQRHGEVPPLLMVTDPVITPGVAGLIAGRLAEEYHRPAVVLAGVDPSFVTASARSIPQFNIIEAFTTCRELFVRFGGHAQAAGFTIARDNLASLETQLSSIAQEHLSSHNLNPVLYVDAPLDLAGLTPGLLQWLHLLEPFGVGNPRPAFLTRNLQVMETQLVGPAGQHVKLRVREGQRECTALAFNQGREWDGSVARVDLVYSISIDHWNGVERLTLKVLDSRPSRGGVD